MVIGICGGSGSGKSTVARHILDALRDKIAHLQQDYYYKDLSNLPLEERAQLNFDHPDAIDLEMLEHHVRELCAGRAVECPRYDFAQYTRHAEFMHVEPQPVIIVEGILIF